MEEDSHGHEFALGFVAVGGELSGEGVIVDEVVVGWFFNHEVRLIGC